MSVIPMPSAAVILARPAIGSIEVLMLRRGAGAVAFGGAWVFPGGVVQATDREPAESDFSSEQALAELTRRGGLPPSDPDEALAVWRAALRELFEEAGVLLAHDAHGRHVAVADPDAADVLGLRKALREERLSLGALLRAEGLRADYRALTYFSHWITLEGLPRRFDTRFFAAAMPLGQAAAHCGVETDEARWVEPRAALREYHEGRFHLVLPTRMHLQRLSQLRTVEAFLVDAASKPVRTVQRDRSDVRPDQVWSAAQTGW